MILARPGSRRPCQASTIKSPSRSLANRRISAPGAPRRRTARVRTEGGRSLRPRVCSRNSRSHKGHSCWGWSRYWGAVTAPGSVGASASGRAARPVRRRCAVPAPSRVQAQRPWSACHRAGERFAAPPTDAGPAPGGQARPGRARRAAPARQRSQAPLGLLPPGVRAQHDQHTSPVLRQTHDALRRRAGRLVQDQSLDVLRREAQPVEEVSRRQERLAHVQDAQRCAFQLRQHAGHRQRRRGVPRAVQGDQDRLHSATSCHRSHRPFVRRVRTRRPGARVIGGPSARRTAAGPPSRDTAAVAGSAVSWMCSLRPFHWRGRTGGATRAAGAGQGPARWGPNAPRRSRTPPPARARPARRCGCHRQRFPWC